MYGGRCGAQNCQRTPHPAVPQGKQIAKQLMQHGVSTSSLELSGGTKSFDWVTHKWNVDYAFYKTSLDKYLLLFKAGQANGLTIDWAQALGEEFCDDHFHGHQAIDNPASERSIRPFCVRRPAGTSLIRLRGHRPTLLFTASLRRLTFLEDGLLIASRSIPFQQGSRVVEMFPSPCVTGRKRDKKHPATPELT